MTFGDPRRASAAPRPLAPSSPLARLPDWRARLDRAIDDIRGRPFDWATQHDCGIGLAGSVVFAITGTDIAAPWRGAYRTRLGALRAMKRAGFGDLAALVASLLPECHSSRARIGDLAACPAATAFGWALGVVNGERIFVLRDDGIGTIGLLDAQRAFRVGQ